MFCFSGQDTRIRFSLDPSPGDPGFNQWKDAMKMVARLPEGVPEEFRKKVPHCFPLHTTLHFKVLKQNYKGGKTVIQNRK